MFLACAIIATPAFAATGINKQINFQGKVVNSDGTNVTNGTYSFTFNFYSVSSAGSAIWTETKSLVVTDGIFRTDLGDTTTLPGSVDFNTDNIYLGINFNSDGEMSPRVHLDAVPQAFNADNLDGVDGGSFLRSDTSDSFTSGTLTFNDSTVLAIGTGNDLQLTHDGTDSSITSATGNLTIANSNITGATIAKLGTGTSATSFQIQNSSGVALFTINGAGTLTASAFTTNGGLLYTNGSGVIAQTGAGTSTTVLHGGTTPTYGAIVLSTDTSGTLPVANGGTGQTSYTNGQILIGNTTGNTLTKATITGTANQVIVTNGAGSITLSTPQDIATSSSPTFTGATITNNANADSKELLVQNTNATGGAGIQIDRGASNVRAAQIMFSTNNTGNWWAGQLRKGGSASTSFSIAQGSDINTTTPSLTILSTNLVGIGVVNPTHTLSFSGNALVTFGQERSTTGAGSNFALFAADALSGGTDLNGGDWQLLSGVSTGTGTSNILFKVAPAGSSGTSDNTVVEAARFAGSGVNFLQGTTTVPTGATYNHVLGGGTTSPVLGAATADMVSLAAVDKAAGDRRLYIQSESGSAISLGNNRLNFAASTGLISIGGTDTLSLTTSALTLTDAVNIAVGTSTGTKIGTATSQKIGFFNATPVVQQTGDISTALSSLGLVTSGTFAGSSVTGTVAVANGGTGQTTYTNGQLLIGNTTGNTLTKATLTGTTNQVVVTNGTGTITLSTPQDIATSSAVQFSTLSLGGSLLTGNGLYVTKTYADTGAANGLFYVNPVYTVTSNAALQQYGFQIVPNITIASGVTNSGSVGNAGFLVSMIRSNSGDLGTLSNMEGGLIQYGNTSTVGSTATTTSAIGLKISPFWQAGTVATAYDLLLASAGTGGTNTTHYGIYQQDTGALNYFGGNGFLVGTTTLPTSSTFNITLGGGATTPVLGAATADTVSLAAVDAAAGDRRLYIQSESGSTISLGNDRLNFAASTGNVSIAGTDVMTMTSSLMTWTAAANPQIRVSSTGVGSTALFQIRNDAQIWQFVTDGSDSNRLKIRDGGSVNALAVTTGYNFQLLGGSTSPTLASAAADTVSLAAVDKAAGDRRLYIQSELGSAISLGNDRLNFAASTGLISIAGTDRITFNSSGLGVGATPTTALELNNSADSAPALSGTTQTGNVIRVRSAGATTLDIGVSATNGYAWLQGVSSTDLSLARIIVLQPNNGGNVGIGATSFGSGSTSNLALGGGATSPVLSIAITDQVMLAAVDKAAGDRRLYIQSESGSAISLGNDRLNFAATTGVVSANGVDVLSINYGGALTINGSGSGSADTRLTLGGLGNGGSGRGTAILIRGPGSASEQDLVKLIGYTTGGATTSQSADFAIQTALSGTLTETARFTSAANLLLGTSTTPTSATTNFVLGGGATTPVLGAATADLVSLAAVDKAAGDRRLYVQSESGSAISLGNDRLNFAASVGAISVGGTDNISLSSTAVNMVGSLGLGGVSVNATTRLIDGSKSFTDPATTSVVMNFGSGSNIITSNNAQVITGIQGDVRLNQNGFNMTNAAGLRGMSANAFATGASGTVTGVAGLLGQVGNLGAGILTDSYFSYANTALNSGGGTLTNNNGYYIAAQTAGTNIYGFRGAIASGTNRYNIYMDGTALNYLNGALLVGNSSDDGVNKLQVTGSISTTGNFQTSGYISLLNSQASYPSLTNPTIYAANGSGTYPFDDAGKLVLQSRSSGAARDIVFVTGTTPSVKMVVAAGGNIGIGTSTFGTSATTNLALGGGSTSPVLGAATADLVSLAAVDATAGDRRLAIQSESGSAISLGNDRLNFAATTGIVSTGGTDLMQFSAGLVKVVYPALGNDSSTAPFQIAGGADVTLGPLLTALGVHPSATGSSRYGYISAGDNAAMRTFVLNYNGSSAFGNVTVGTTSVGTSATQNFVIGGPATSPVLGAATADLVSLAAVDKAAGDRRLYIQSELGSAISLGNDRLNFAASTGLISVAGTDVLSSTASTVTVPVSLTVNGTTTVNGLSVIKSAQAGIAESLAGFYVGDDANSFILFNNSTNTDGVFSPTITGQQSTTQAGLNFTGVITTDTGTTPALVYTAYLVGGASPVATRPLVGWNNLSTRVMTLTSGVNLQLAGGATSPTLASATADVVSMAPVDKAAGDRRLYIQSELGSAISLGNDRLNFAGTTNYLSTGGTDLVSLASDAVTIAASGGVGSKSYLSVGNPAGSQNADKLLVLNTATIGAGSYFIYAVPSTAGGSFTLRGDGQLALTSTGTTGATTASAAVLNLNSLTTGTGLYAASSTLQSGKLVDLQVSGTAAAASQTALNILTTGVTATNAITTYGAQISNTHSNATSGTNVALLLSASGATTANYGLVVSAGNSGFGNAAPAQRVDVTGTIRQSNAINCALTTNASGDINCTSDERLKDLQGYYDGGLLQLNQVNPIRFSYKNEQYVHVGFSAQNIASVVPEGAPVQGNGFYGLDSNAVLALTVNSVKQLDTKTTGIQTTAAATQTDIVNLQTQITNIITSLAAQAGDALSSSEVLKLLAQNLTFTGNIAFAKDVTMSGGLIADAISINKTLLVNGASTFKGEVTLSDKQAGFAKILKYASSVDVKFTTELVNTPVVQVTAQGSSSNYWVDTVTTKGFTLHVSTPSSQDTQYAWIAITSDDPKTTISEPGITPTPTPVATLSPTATPTPTPEITPSPTLDPAPSDTPTPEPTTSPT